MVKTILQGRPVQWGWITFERHDAEGAGRAVFNHVTAARDRLLKRMADGHVFTEGAAPLPRAESRR